ncbi:MAG: PadR family transcriptional regulator [Anaerolineaceae bacterium]
MENTQDPIQSILLELRRGILAVVVLSQLDHEQYGYSLLKLISDQGLIIDQGTLYPLLRRLESQGLLRSDWRIIAETRPRRYYVISQQGREALIQLKSEWLNIVETVQKMLS